LLDKFIEISKITGISLQDTLDGGETVRIENLLLKEFNKRDFVLPLKPDSKEISKRIEEREAHGLKGALVLEPVVGLHTNVVYLDFKAMYPSIIIAYNICPTTMITKKIDVEKIVTPNNTEFVTKKVREGIIPAIVDNLIKERDKLKTQMKTVADEKERKILDTKQDALKIITNSFYGQIGYLKARLYVLDIANTITACGRSIIKTTKDIVERNSSFKVIYGDTDSVMVKPNVKDIEETFLKGEEIEKKINEEIGDKVKIKIEGIFKTLLILSKKRYAGLMCIKTNGELKEDIVMKGIETVRRDWCNLVEETLYTVLEIILKEQNTKKAFDYVKSVLEKLEKNQIPIEKLVVAKSVSKPIKEYKGVQPHIELLKKLRKRSPGTAPGIGDRIGFVIVKGPQLISERAEDPEYVKQAGLKIDSKYYIESQVLPPLERVFEAIGIGKSELVGFGKQLLLTEAIKNGVKKPEKEQPLQKIDGIICSNCNKTFRRVPLIGKCTECSGELMFYFGENRSRYYAL
jgi:DNA polymerase I